MTNEELVLLIQTSGKHKNYLEELYIKNERVIASIANKYKSYAEFDDLMQEGYFGLIEAAEAWDESKGASFITYAVYWIRASMNRYIDNHAYVVRIPAYQRELIYKINRVSEMYYKQYAHAPTISELSCILDKSEAIIRAVLYDAVFLEVKSTNEKTGDDSGLTIEDKIKAPGDAYEDVERSIQNDQLSQVLWKMVDELRPEDAMVLHEHYEHGKSIDDLAGTLGKDPGQVRNIKQRALRSLGKGANRKKLKPFMDDERIYSISIHYSSYGRFKNTWTSSTEEAAIMAEL